MSDAAGLDLTSDTLTGFAPGRFFRDAGAAINSLDFHRTEDLLVCAADDDSLRLYDVASGALLKTLFAKTYGASKVCFTHAPTCILAASGVRRNGASEHDVRYHSFHDNTYLRFFKGHTGRVVSLAMSPMSDAFLSAAEDRTCRLWDLRTPVCSGVMRACDAPVAAWDHQGLVYAVITDDGVLKMFDAKQYEQGPFITFTLAAPPAPKATSMSFSLDGKLLLVCAGGMAVVVDAFEGKTVHRFTPPCGAPGCEAAFTPDARHVLMGGADGLIYVWAVSSGRCVAHWRGHSGLPAALRWAPRRAMAASGCANGGMALWVPPAPVPEAPPQQPLPQPHVAAMPPPVQAGAPW